MESPQLENGYTRIANEILDRTMKTRFSGTQKDIVLAIWRYTYGFGRKEHGLSIDFLAEATDMYPKLVKRNIDSLVDRNIIQITLGAAGTRSRKIAFNKNYEQWKDPPDKSLEGAKQGTLVNRRNTTKKTQIAPTNLPKLPPLEGAKQPPKKEKRKSLKKKDIYTESSEEMKDIPYQKILDYLNLKAGKKYTIKSKPTISFINGRFSEGRTLEDFFHVIDVKVSHWLNDPKWDAYLRPSTLFNATNFENYLNQKITHKPMANGTPSKTDLSSDVLRNAFKQEVANEENGIDSTDAAHNKLLPELSGD